MSVRRSEFLRGRSWLAALLLSAAWPAWGQASRAVGEAPAVVICDGVAEWTPFTYFRRSGGVPTGELTGYSVEVVGSILRKAGLGYRIELLPWKRCLAEVARGDAYQIALDASYSEERARTYWLSRPFYRISSHYFFLRSRFPDGPSIQSATDLRRYRLCGLRGYNYEAYGVDAAGIDLSSGDYSVLLQRLKLDRCDLFVEKIEVLSGYAVTGRDLLADPDLGHRPIPGFPPSDFQMLISRNAPNAAELLRVINAGIVEMESSHQLDKLWAKYLR